jgi:hypothetical protein
MFLKSTFSTLLAAIETIAFIHFARKVYRWKSANGTQRALLCRLYLFLFDVMVVVNAKTVKHNVQDIIAK